MSLCETRPSNLRALESRLETLKAQFIERNPLSKEAAERARLSLPGGTTRSVLHSEPFPVAIKSARGAVLTSIDGHEYIDFVSDFTAGLFGHSNDAIQDAVVRAASSGFSLGAVTELESRLSQSICGRFPSVELVRFCNSGTEANTYALAAALAYTRRNKVVASTPL
jgi:glutamate-1-semialdehyde 2,1-aminomutase